MRKVARQHGDQIAAILIRNVTQQSADDERFGRAFEGIPRRRWRLFRQAGQLPGLLVELDREQEVSQ